MTKTKLTVCKTCGRVLSQEEIDEDFCYKCDDEPQDKEEDEFYLEDEFEEDEKWLKQEDFSKDYDELD